MNNVPENELLSAYLDGELTAEEQARVERLLAADPEARQLVDELRALSSSVKALPPHAIGRDISEEVISRAQRQMPTPPAPARAREHEPPEDENQVPAWRAIVRRVARPRNFVWSAVAVAVVVLLMVMKPDTLNGPRRPSIAMKSAADAEQPAATPGPAPSIQSREVAVEVLVAEEAAPAEMPARGVAAGRIGLGEVEARGGEARGRPDRRAPSASTPVAAPQLAVERPAEPSMGVPGAGYPGGVGGMGAGAGVADDRGKADAPRVAGRAAYKGPPSLAAKKAESPEIEAAAESAPAKAGQRRRRAVDEPGLLMVVSCDVTPDAQHGNVFKELLDRCQVSDAVMRVVPGGDTLGSVSAGERVAPADRPELRAVAGKPFQVVEVDVEATGDQIKALLAELHDRPGQFLSLSYTLDPGAVSRGLGRLEADGQAAAPRQASEALHEDVQIVGRLAGPETAQQKLSRADVDQVLDLAKRFYYGRQLGEEAQPGATLGLEALPVPSLPQKEGMAGAAASQPAMGQDDQRGQAKLRASLVAPGPGAARLGAGGAFGERIQPTAPAEAPATSPADAVPMETQRPSESEAGRLDPESGRYRVRFVLRVVGPPGGNVAASLAKEAPAKDAPMIDMAAEAAEAAPEASGAKTAVPQTPESQAAGAKP